MKKSVNYQILKEISKFSHAVLQSFKITKSISSSHFQKPLITETGSSPNYKTEKFVKIFLRETR